MSSAIQLNLLGQSIWYDNVNRALINDGTFKRMIERREIYGVTSNPSIFQKAITQSKDYETDLRSMSWSGMDSKAIFYRLAIQDIQDVADIFRPYYDATNGADGFVSLEVNPNLAHDTRETIEEAKWLWAEVNRPNLMVKIPATKAGLPAITEAISAGINVNITLIFSRTRYLAVMGAYLDGLQKRLDEGKDISKIASVASFFVSRLETKADERLQLVIDHGGPNAEVAKTLRGKIAVDNTRMAYKEYENVFNSEQFKNLAESGAQKQRPLWASTSTKDPAYSDIKYVEELVAENTVNTIPPRTLDAYLGRGDPKITIYDHLDQAAKDFEKLEHLGISIDEITQELEDEGVKKFADSYNALIDVIETQRKQFVADLGQFSIAVASEVNAFKASDVILKIYRNDPTFWTESPEGKDEVQKRMAWLDLPFKSQALIPTLEAFAKDCEADGLTKGLLLGMGGSSLAPETMSLVTEEETGGFSLRILDSTIPEQIREAEVWAEYENTLFIVASKSGTTSETLTLFHYFWEKSEEVLGDKRSSHFVAITDPGSKLEALGSSYNFRKVFTANPNVGGRFSALTLFGLVPAALLGIDLEKFLDHAQEFMKTCFSARDIEKNYAALLGILLGLGETDSKDKLTFIADEVTMPLGAWLEQLVAESSGKQGRGIIPVANEPLIDAGAYSGDRIFVYLRKTGEMDRFVDRLRDAGHTLTVVDIPDINDLATQFYLWELAIAVACSIIGVNAFDQPDVQDSKRRTKDLINAYQTDGRLDEPEPIWVRDGTRVYGSTFEGLGDCKSVSDVIDKFISLSGEMDYVAINAFLSRNETIHQTLQDLRKSILQKNGRATTLGFGPRLLHSTGQLHKGGPNTGLFIQITQDVADDIKIPGKDYSFGILARAQAQGDLEALQARDRRVIRIHLQADDPLTF